MRQKPAFSMSTFLVLAASLSANAAGAEVQALPTPPEARWQAQADVGYVTSGPFSGWGLGLRALAVWRYVAVGAGVDTASLGASGIAPGNGQPFEKSFRSTYGGGLVRGRLPIGVVTPYAEVGVGYAWIGSDTGTNTQCSYRSSIDGELAAGADVRVARGLELGLRWATRRPGAAGSCELMAGPWNFQFQSLQSFTVGAGYRW